MGFRFRRSVKIAPGVKLNLGKTGMSLTAGRRGASVTFSSKGTYGNIGIPGTGISYRTRLDKKEQKQAITSQQVKTSIVLAVDEKGYVIARDLDGKELPSKAVKMARDEQPDKITSWLKNECRKLNDDINSILNIHLDTPPLDAFNFFKESEFPEAPPSEPKLKAINFWCKILPFLKKRVNDLNTKAIAEYETALSAWQAEKNNYEIEQTAFKKKFEEDRYNTLSVMEDFLEDTLQAINWPRETLINFDLANDGQKVLIDLDLPEIEDLPDTTAEVAKSGLKLNFKKRSATQMRKDYMTHIHGIGFRTIGSTFAILPTVKEVVLSVYSQRLDSATGIINDDYLYSLKVARQQWNVINLNNIEQIDPIECLSKFEIVRDMSKTGVFKAITPLAS